MFSKDECDEMAICIPEVDIKKALIKLYNKWDIKPSNEALDQTACHEVLHILLAPIMELASERYVTEKQLGDAEHDVIRALERVFFE
jgi:hypothetical protein